jgi:hypothetical protein
MFTLVPDALGGIFNEAKHEVEDIAPVRPG